MSWWLCLDVVLIQISASSPRLFASLLVREQVSGDCKARGEAELKTSIETVTPQGPGPDCADRNMHLVPVQLSMDHESRRVDALENRSPLSM